MTFSLLSLFRTDQPAPASERNSARFTIDKVTVSREKIALPSFVLDGTRSDEKIKPALLRFSRLRIQIRTQSEERCLTVVGRRVNTLIRMASLIAAEVERVPAFLFPNSRAKTDWAKIWQAALAAIFKHHCEGEWVRIYLDGLCEFTAGSEQKFYDTLESVAAGGELEEQKVQTAAAKAVSSHDSVPAKYTGQTYLVISQSGDLYRGAFTDRKNRHDQTLFAHAPVMIEERTLRLSRFVAFCADVVNALVMKPVVASLKALPDDERKAKLNILLDAVEHQAACLTRIVGFERSHRARFRPERPVLE